MAETDPTKMAPSSQGTLREEDNVWAVDNGENTESLVRACQVAAPRGGVLSLALLPCA